MYKMSRACYLTYTSFARAVLFNYEPDTEVSLRLDELENHTLVEIC